MVDIEGKMIERIINIPSSICFNKFMTFVESKKYSIGEAQERTGNLVFKTKLGGWSYLRYNGNYIFSCSITSFGENRTKLTIQGVVSCSADIAVLESIFNFSAQLGKKIVSEFVKKGNL